MASPSAGTTASSSPNYGVDIKAGLVVFLIALPLSIGISLASGAPTSAGLISAALGGIIGAYLGGSYVTINGPAAGLIVVVLGAIQSLSDGDPVLGFRRMLACVVVVGVLQILSGLLKAGKLAALFPLSVVHGMLTAIGVIIMIKQIHVFFGHKAQGSIVNSMLMIPDSALHPIAESALVGLVAFVILLVYPHLKMKVAKIIPAPLIVVIVGIVMAKLIGTQALVSIPTNPSELVAFPLFDKITSPESLRSIFTIFFVASLESILSAIAVDKLDPLGRESNFNRELWSKGVVNLACGMIGGLPIIAEIVRSSANISQGAKTPLANFSHGIFILIFILVFPGVLNTIPQAALAAILVLVGFRLAHPRQFKEMWHLGGNSFVAFVTTVVLTVADDLLVGVFAGVIVKALISLFMGVSFKDLFSPSYDVHEQGSEAILKFQGSLNFFSVLKQRKIIEDLAKFRQIKIDLTQVRYIDATSLTIIAKETAKLEKQGMLVIIILPEPYEAKFHALKSH